MKQVINNKENLDEPPSSICKSITDRICAGPNDGRSLGRREVALLQHLSSPDLSARFRNNLVILETI